MAFDKYKTAMFAGAIFIISVLIVISIIPPLVDDLEQRPYIDSATGEKIPRQKINPIFIGGILACVILPVIYLITLGEEFPEFARTRSIVEIWEDIPEFDLINYGLKQIEGMHFSEDTIVAQTLDPNVILIRIVDINLKQGVKYAALDQGEDWKKRRTKSPLLGVITDVMSWMSAQSLLVKNRQDYRRFISQGQQLGIPIDELRKNIAERKLVQSQQQMNINPE